MRLHGQMTLKTVLFVALAMLVTGCGNEVSIDHETMGPKPRISTYAWLPNNVSDPKIDAPYLDTAVKSAVNKELDAKGYTLDTKGKPTFLATYHAVLTKEVKTVTINNHVDQQAAAYVGDSQYYTPQMKQVTYDRGTLILDFMKTDDPDNFWRGSAKGKAYLKESKEKRQERIQQIVAEIMESFPSR